MQNNENVADLQPVLAPMGEHNTTERGPLVYSSFLVLHLLRAWLGHGWKAIMAVQTQTYLLSGLSIDRLLARMLITCSIVLQTYCNIILVLHLIGHLFLLVSSVTSLITCSCWSRRAPCHLVDHLLLFQ